MHKTESINRARVPSSMCKAKSLIRAYALRLSARADRIAAFLQNRRL